MWKYNSPDELYHWGILGMHWGRRKSNSPKSFVNNANKKVEEKMTKSYTKSMYKYGRPGSFYDQKHGGKSTRLYDSIKSKKGKEYADKIISNTDKKIDRSLIINGAGVVASLVAVGWQLHKLKRIGG